MKQQRKLFAILTLVMFMMTLLPLAAFAADADRNASILRVSSTKSEADGKKKAEFTVYVRDAGNKATQESIYVASERSADVIIPTLSSNKTEYKAVYYSVNSSGEKVGNPVTIDAGTTFTKDQAIAEFKTKVRDNLASGSGYVVEITPGKDGKAEFDVYSQVSGDALIAVGLTMEGKHNPYGYIVDSNVTTANAKIIGTKTITFEATKSNDVVLTKVTDRRNLDTYTGSDLNEDTYNNNSKEGSRIYGVERNVSGAVINRGLQIDNIKANNTDYYEVTFQVLNASNAPVEGERVRFSANKTNVRFNNDEIRTNEIGEVEVRVYANKAGDYEIEATIGSQRAKTWLTFAPAEISNITLTNKPDPMVAIDEADPATFRIELTDAVGNRVDPATVGELAEILEFEWIVEPNGSDLDDEYWKSGLEDIDDGTKAKGGYGTTNTTVRVRSDNLLQFRLPELDEEGKYSLRVNIENGRSVDVEFEGKEQGDIVNLTVSYDTTTVQLGGRSSDPTVKRLDKNGVTTELSTSEKKNDIQWSVSDYRVLRNTTVNYDNAQVSARNLSLTAGTLFVTDDDDYIGTYTVTAVDKKEDLSASATITIGLEAIGIEVETPNNVLPVGKDSTVTVKSVDASGSVVSLGKDAKNVEFEYYVVRADEGVRVSATEFASEGKFQSDMQDKGQASVDVHATKAGTADLVFIVSYTDTTTETKGYYHDGTDVVPVLETVEKEFRFTKTVKLTFGEEAGTGPVIGAKNVTLFIGSTGAVVDGTAAILDASPFIQDSRTFVPVRFVGEALGAKVSYDAATQIITMVREDVTITLTIGSNILTLSNGNAVVSDVAPFITNAGRTVLPFRAVAEAFGAEVKADFAADGTVSSVTFTQ